jgi:hypothetical protein
MQVGDLVIMKGPPMTSNALKAKYGIGLVTELWNRRPVQDVEVWWPKAHADYSRTMSVDCLVLINQSR